MSRFEVQLLIFVDADNEGEAYAKVITPDTATALDHNSSILVWEVNNIENVSETDEETEDE